MNNNQSVDLDVSKFVNEVLDEQRIMRKREYQPDDNTIASPMAFKTHDDNTRTIETNVLGSTADRNVFKTIPV